MGATSADVARHAGLSRATVSQVLNGHRNRFAPETAERVLRAAKELSYEPSSAGRMLRRGSSDFVVVLVPNTSFGGNLQNIFDTVTDLFAEHGLTLVLRLATNSPASLDRLVEGMRPRAVMALQPLSESEQAILAKYDVAAIDTAVGDDLGEAIGRLQASYLIARGYQRIAFAHLADERLDPYGASREEAVRACVMVAGLPEPTVVSLGIDPHSADSALDRLSRGTGVACYNDDVAITLMAAAGRRGWQVPSEIGLMGMDNTPLSHVLTPRLTTVGYDYTAVASAVMSAAMALLDASFVREPVDIGLRVIPGESAGESIVSIDSDATND